MFLIGVLVGAACFAIMYLVMIISKIHAGMIYLHHLEKHLMKGFVRWKKMMKKRGKSQKIDGKSNYPLTKVVPTSILG